MCVSCFVALLNSVARLQVFKFEKKQLSHQTPHLTHISKFKDISFDGRSRRDKTSSGFLIAVVA